MSSPRRQGSVPWRRGGRNALRAAARARGVALITAMVVTALATAAAVSMLSGLNLEVRRTQNVLSGAQAWQHGLGVEAWAQGVLLRELAEQQQRRQALAEGRPLPPPAPPVRSLPTQQVDGGEVAGRIVPLQGRFNLNDLLVTGTAAGPAAGRGTNPAALAAPGTAPTAAASPSTSGQSTAAPSTPATPAPDQPGPLSPGPLSSGMGEGLSLDDKSPESSGDTRKLLIEDVLGYSPTLYFDGAQPEAEGFTPPAPASPEPAAAPAPSASAAADTAPAATEAAPGGTGTAAAPAASRAPISPVALERLRRLLSALELDPALANAVADWLDADRRVRVPGGAEDDHYLLADPPYRSANGPFVDLEELRQVRGVTPEVYAVLAPHLVVLPPGAGLDVNLAQPEVLRALVDDMSDSALESLLAGRPYASLEAFLAAPAFREGPPVPYGLQVGSEYFEVQADVRMDRVEVRASALLRRSEGEGASIIARERRAPGEAG